MLVSSNAVNCAKCEKIWIVYPFQGNFFFAKHVKSYAT